MKGTKTNMIEIWLFRAKAVKVTKNIKPYLSKKTLVVK
jgi:hypothetical protein